MSDHYSVIVLWSGVDDIEEFYDNGHLDVGLEIFSVEKSRTERAYLHSVPVKGMSGMSCECAMVFSSNFFEPTEVAEHIREMPFSEKNEVCVMWKGENDEEYSYIFPFKPDGVKVM